MSGRRVSQFTKPRYSPAPWEATVLVQIDARYVPTAWRDLEPRKLRFNYSDDAEFAIGYNSTCRYQEALLMDVADRLISEVRALREGAGSPIDTRDPALDPYGLALVSMADLIDRAEDGNATAADMLTELQAIRAAVETGGIDGAGLFEKLDTLILLLGAA